MGEELRKWTMPDDLEIRLEPFQARYSRELRRVALESWLYTYRNIYTRAYINRFIRENYKISTLKALEKFVDSGVISFNVAVFEGKLIGFCQFGRDREFTLLRIYLKPEWMGRGIGSALLERGEEWVKEKGGKSYIVNVQKDNVIGINFYRKKGFKDERSSGDELCLRKLLI